MFETTVLRSHCFTKQLPSYAISFKSLQNCESFLFAYFTSFFLCKRVQSLATEYLFLSLPYHAPSKRSTLQNHSFSVCKTISKLTMVTTCFKPSSARCGMEALCKLHVEEFKFPCLVKTDNTQFGLQPYLRVTKFEQLQCIFGSMRFSLCENQTKQ